ncbi:MAG TPA: signal peptidase I [Acidimicrobiia bacterium]|jgi:signal peptidase|nr:signal peptidase I [Acidimicrobiia bacterium]
MGSLGVRVWIYARFAMGLGATFLLTAAGALMVYAIGIALVFGWNGYAMQSGSMSPAIKRGDVVLSMSPPRVGNLGDGTIVVFTDADARTIAHRIVGRTPAGAYVTRGDANQTADSDPLLPKQVHAVGRLLVPYVGLPFVWWQEGQIGDLFGLGVLLTLCASLARYARVAPSDRVVSEQA